MRQSIAVLFTALFINKEEKKVNDSLVDALREAAYTDKVTIICNMEDKESLEELVSEFDLGNVEKYYFWNADKDNLMDTFRNCLFIVNSKYTSPRLFELINDRGGKVLINNVGDPYDERFLRRMFDNYWIRVSFFNGLKKNSFELFELINTELESLSEWDKY